MSCRFKVFADYEDYIRCQERVSALYKVCSAASEVMYTLQVWSNKWNLACDALSVLTEP